MTAEDARSFVRSVEADLRALCIEVGLADWAATTAGTPEARDRSTEAERRLRRFHAEPERYRRTEELLGSAAVDDPTLRRQLELLALAQRPNQLEERLIDDLVERGKAIEAEFTNFRAELDGRPVTHNEIIEVLRTERDPGHRRAAWLASKQIGAKVAERILELVVRRNEAAAHLGYRDFYAMQLQLQEIDEAELLRTFATLKEATDDPFREAKARVDQQLARRFGIDVEQLRPWHYDDPFFQEPPGTAALGLDVHFRGRDIVAIAERFYRGIGLDVSDVLRRSDLLERDGKNQYAYCIEIDREGDVRILCNLRDDERWMGILLHELGHAAYDSYIPRSLPWLLREPAHTATTEAVALFMDRLLLDADWLIGAAGARPEDEAELRARLSEALRFESLLMARWVPVMTLFERELYAHPESPDELSSLWWDLVEEYQQLRRPEGRRAPDWAAKLHLAVAPVYYHNYLLGELIASQLGRAFRRDVLAGTAPRGYVGRRELGAFLRDRVFAHGSSLHWQDLLERATRSRLALEAFEEDFLRGPEAATGRPGGRPREARAS